MKKQPCGTPGCNNPIVGLVTKFGEKGSEDSPVTTAPGQQISIWYCEGHKDRARAVLDAL
jgi:hypothetical protein